MTKLMRFPPDPKLPGLQLALDPEALRTELERRLPECRDGFEVLEVDPTDVQYQPGESASILVKVKLGGAGRPTLRPLLFFQALPLGVKAAGLPEAALARYRERRERTDGRSLSPLEDPRQSWPELGLHLHVFPLDPRLPTLGDVLDPDYVREALHRAWKARGMRVRRVGVELLSYTPRARAALRYEVLCEDRVTGLPSIRRLVGKLQRRKHPARLFSGHWALWRQLSGRVSIVPPVGYVACAGLSLQEFIEGERLSDLAGGGRFVKHLREAGRAIADVHATTLPLPGQRDAAKECRVVQRWVDVVARLRPDLRERLERHGQRLQASLEERFRARGTVHSDFHLANIMVGAAGVTFIDWDQVCHGDPALDPGRLLGSLRVTALRVSGDAEGLADAGEAFLEAYLARRGEDERQVRLFESVALLISSASPFRLQRAGWEEQAEQLVEQSELALKRALSRPPLPAAAPSPRPFPLATRRRWALDRTLVQSLLVPEIQRLEGSDLEVTECRPRVLEEDEGLLHLKVAWKGWQGEQRRYGTAELVGLEGRSGGGMQRRLELVTAALAAAGPGQDPAEPGAARALELPASLGQLEPISLVAMVPCAGEPLEESLGTAAEKEGLDRLGEALGGLARLRVALDKRRSLERESGGLARRVERLELASHPLAPRLQELLRGACELAGATEVPLAPAPYPLELSDLRWAAPGGRVGLRIVRDFVSAPAPAAVAALLAELHAASLRGAASTAAVQVLRESFSRASGSSPRSIAAAEALALIRRAARRLQAEPDEPQDGLLQAAAEALRRGAALA